MKNNHFQVVEKAFLLGLHVVPLIISKYIFILVKTLVKFVETVLSVIILTMKEVQDRVCMEILDVSLNIF